jgi:hypothetical protein
MALDRRELAKIKRILRETCLTLDDVIHKISILRQNQKVLIKYRDSIAIDEAPGSPVLFPAPAPAPVVAVAPSGASTPASAREESASPEASESGGSKKRKAKPRRGQKRTKK